MFFTITIFSMIVITIIIFSIITIAFLIIVSIIIFAIEMGAKGVEQLPLIASIGFKPPRPRPEGLCKMRLMKMMMNMMVLTMRTMIMMAVKMIKMIIGLSHHALGQRAFL